MKPEYPLIRLPRKVDFCIYLIREELKSRRFFEGMQKVGVDDVYLQPHLDIPILQMIGLDDGSDEVAEVCFDIFERRSKKVKDAHNSIVMQAVKAYMELMEVKKKRKKSTGNISGLEAQ